MKRREPWVALGFVTAAVVAACGDGGDGTGTLANEKSEAPATPPGGAPAAGGDTTASGGTATSAAPAATSTSSTPAPAPAPSSSSPPKSTPPSGGSSGGTNGTVTVKFAQGCWFKDGTKKYQAVPFSVSSPSPKPLEGTLFFNTTCDPKDGTDNLNDTGATTPSGSWTYWFIHHPDETATSARWSYDGITSVCVDYSNAPDC